MINYRNNNRRNKFRTNNRNFRGNGSNISDFGSKNNFQRRAPGSSSLNAPKLIEKYNNLARESLSSGDKILSENYYQHADHFLRILLESKSSRSEPKKENEELEKKDLNSNIISKENNLPKVGQVKLAKDI